VDLFQRGFDTNTGTFSGVGKLLYDVAPDRICYFPSGSIAVEERFLDSDTARKMFFNALPARLACKLLKLQDDLIEQISTTDFADCLRVIVSRLSTEFPFDGSDHIYTVGVKHVLSSVLCVTLSPFASRVMQKSFFHLRTWSTIYTWIQQEGSILPRLDVKPEDPAGNAVSCVGAFLLSEKALVEKIVEISHDFFLMLKRGVKEMKGT
jgi:hypothetical protein